MLVRIHATCLRQGILQEVPTAAIQNKAMKVLVQGTDAYGNNGTDLFAGSMLASVNPSGPTTSFSDVAPGALCCFQH